MDLSGTDPDTNLQPSGYYVKETEKNVLSEEMIFFFSETKAQFFKKVLQKGK